MASSTETKTNISSFMPWLMVIVGTIFYCYESLLRVAPSVMRLELMLNYSIDAGTFSTLIAFYYYIYAPMQLFVGVLMDRYGPRRLLTLAAFTCAIGTYSFVATKHLVIGEIGRLLIGFGSSFAFVGVLKIASLWLPQNKFALISGTTMALGMVGGLLGDTAVTSLVTFEGWKLASIHAAILGLFLTVIVFVVIKDHNQAPNADVSETSSFRDVLSGLWVLLSSPQSWIIGAIGCLMWFPISIYAEAWGVGHLQDALGYGREQASHGVALIFLGMACGGPCVGMLSDYIKKRKPVIFLGALLTFIVSSLIIYVPTLSISLVYFLLFLFGFFNSPQVLVFPMAKEATNRHSVGSALAVTNMLVMSAGVIQPATGYLLRYMGPSNFVNGAPIYGVEAYQIALAIIPISLLLTMILVLFAKETFQIKK
ncbi:MAG: MFS transporter [Pseudomonadota bacterium]|nr:MFS transporter [Pseudomonadota bacterium]